MGPISALYLIVILILVITADMEMDLDQICPVSCSRKVDPPQILIKYVL